MGISHSRSKMFASGLVTYLCPQFSTVNGCGVGHSPILFVSFNIYDIKTVLDRE